MLRAFDCSAFIPSPPRTFSDSVGFTLLFAPLRTVYQRRGPLLARVRGCAHHRAAPKGAQDLVASQSTFAGPLVTIEYTPIWKYAAGAAPDACHRQYRPVG